MSNVIFTADLLAASSRLPLATPRHDDHQHLHLGAITAPCADMMGNYATALMDAHDGNGTTSTTNTRTCWRSLVTPAT